MPSFRQASAIPIPLPASISMVRRWQMISSAVYRVRAMPPPFGGWEPNSRPDLVYRGQVRPAERREVVAHMISQGGLPVQRACQAVGLGRATYYRPVVNWAQRDASVIEALTTLGATYPRWGFWKYVDRLRLTGHRWNHKRLWRVYCRLRLNLPRRTKKRLPVRPVQPMDVIPQPNVVWALDFMSDTLYGGRRFRTLNILDEGVREVLAIEVDTSLPAERVIRVLEQVTAWRGKPQAMRLDNGPEFLADRFASWCADRGIALRFIQP